MKTMKIYGEQLSNFYKSQLRTVIGNILHQMKTRDKEGLVQFANRSHRSLLTSSLFLEAIAQERLKDAAFI